MLPALEEALHPGTVPRQSMMAPGIDQVEAYRAERNERHILRAKYLPESTSPADLDIVMVLSDVKVFLSSAYFEALGVIGLPRRCRKCNHMLEEHGGSNGARCGLCQPCPGFGFTYVPPGDWRAWDAVLSSSDAVADAIEHLVHKITKMAESALGHERSWLLMVKCPWCDGKNAAMPNGSLTLRAYVPTGISDAYVLCLNPACEPDEDACGRRKGGRPMWSSHELAWLSDRMDDSERFRKLKKMLEDDVA